MKGKKRRVTVSVCKSILIWNGKVQMRRHFCIITYKEGLFTANTMHTSGRSLKRIAEIIRNSLPDEIIYDIPENFCQGSSYVSYLDGYFGRPLIPAAVWQLEKLTPYQESILRKNLGK